MSQASGAAGGTEGVLVARCEAVMDRAQLVRLDDEKIAHVAATAPEALLTIPRWDEEPAMFRGHADATITWLVTYNAINFCYWPEPGQPRWWTTVRGEPAGRDDEALGIMAAIGRAIQDGVPFGDWRWLRQLDEDELGAILAPAKGAGPLPLMEQRLAALHELGEASRRYSGPPSLFEAARGSAATFVDLLLEVAPTWRDLRRYEELALPFYKRAWLCAAMIFSRLQDDPIRRFQDPDVIPVFADYRLPQVLRGMGILSLEAGLAERIAREEHLAAGSPEEVELRAATVAAGGRLTAALQERLPGTMPLQVDHFLWRTAVQVQDQLPPFHRTRTTDY